MAKQQTSYFLYFAAFSIQLIVFGAGMAYSWTSPFLPKFKSNEMTTNPIARPVTTSEAGLLVSITSLGLLIGPIIPALITEKFGKKRSLLLSATPLLVAHIMCSLAKTIELFLVARFLMGIACGATAGITPTYIGEISEPRNRGLLGSLFSVMTSSGTLFVYGIGPFLSMKWFSIINLIPILIFYIFVLFFIPESPYDLVKGNQLEKAEQSLSLLRKNSDVHAELAEIKKSIEDDRKNTGTFLDLFKNKGLIRAMIISAGVMVFNPLSGIVPLLGYTQTIFELAGSSLAPETGSIIVASISLITAIVHSNIVDRMGRKILITTSCGITFISFSALGAFFYLQENNVDVDSIGWLPVGSLVLYMIGFYLGLGAIPYIIVGELFPSNVKAVAAGFCVSLNYSLTFILTLSFPYLLEYIGTSFTFWLLAAFSACAFIFCVTVVPETKGKTLQEIIAMLSGGSK